MFEKIETSCISSAFLSPIASRLRSIGRLSAYATRRHRGRFSLFPCCKVRPLAAISLIGCIIFSIAGNRCYAAGGSSKLAIGFTASAFQDVTNTDIKAAVKVLMQRVALMHFDKGESRYYDNLSEMAADMEHGNIQAMGIPVEEFIELRRMVPLDPLLVTSSTNGTETELLLLARKDSGIDSIWDLKGKSIVIPNRNPRYCTLFQVWVESMLSGKSYSKMEDFFSSVREAKTTAKAIMPVFFRQADACVVTRQVLDLTAELNPQISRELAIIASKGKLAQGIIAVDRNLSETERERIMQAFLTLHQTPDGEQLLMLFKVKRLIPIPSGYLKETEALYGKLARLKRNIR